MKSNDKNEKCKLLRELLLYILKKINEHFGKIMKKNWIFEACIFIFDFRNDCSDSRASGPPRRTEHPVFCGHHQERSGW